MTLDEQIVLMEDLLSDDDHWSCETAKTGYRQLLEWLKDYKRLLERSQGDLISRDALKEALKSNCEPELCNDYGTNWCEACCPHNDFEDLIDNVPIVKDRYDEGYAQGYIDGSTGADWKGDAE